MKIIEKESKTIKKFEVDYENGIKCSFTTTNGKLTKYDFFSETNFLTYVENIDELKNIHWSKHSEILGKQKKLTISKIKTFNSFDKLFYVGGHIDGMLQDKDGNFISSIIILDDIFSHCWLHIEKKKEKCQKIIDSLNTEYIVDAKVVEIPYYNQNNNKKHHYTIVLSVKLTDELFNKFMGSESYLNDTIKVNIFNFLKS